MMSLFQESVRLGRARVAMGSARRLLEREVADSVPAGRFFVVRHADGALHATAVADTAADLARVVDALDAARRSLHEAGALDADLAST